MQTNASRPAAAGSPLGLTAQRRRALIVAGTTALLIGFALQVANAYAQTPAPTLPTTGTIAVPTYESAGLYWQNPGGTAGCEVKYRKADETAWSDGLPMWFDSRDTQCRGSLVHLAPNTDYQVEFNLPGQAATRGLVFKTWSNQLPIARTITVNSATTMLNVSEGGSATGGYVVYQGASGAVLDGLNAAQYNITVNASYVIIRGLKLTGAKQDAIRISPNVKDVVIEDNEITQWGRTRDGKWGTNLDSAIRAYCSSGPTLERVTIQRNKIHSPRYSSNSWSDGHPAGPQAISFSHCGGNHVFRHNEIYSGNGNYYNDIIGGEDNFTKVGFPNADTDIYGNLLSHAWDDAIEAEGANENVRIWGNYIDRTAIGIATTATSIGPVYIFRNVWNRSQFYQKAALDSDDRQPFFKSGGSDSLGHGRRYVFHNTMLQAQQAGLLYGLGGGYGMGGTGSTQLITNTFSKNNIYHLWKPTKSAFYQTGSGNEIAHDMYSGTAGTTIVNGINATPSYVAGHGWQSEAGGNYQLAPGTPGVDAAVRLPNFNDGFSGSAPDVGAHEGGGEAMKFGLAGSAGPAVGGSVAPPATDPPAATSYALSLTTMGSGTGTVVSTPSGISCGSSCSTSFASGTVVTLVATPSSGSTFAGWSGACSGTGDCSMTMDAAKDVTATFTATPVALTGNVTITPTLLDFRTGPDSKNKVVTRTVSFTNNTSGRVTFGAATLSSPRFSQTNNCGAVESGASCTAAVSYHSERDGSKTGTFTITSDAPNSPHVVELTAAGK